MNKHCNHIEPWDTLREKVNDGVELDPVEQFVYDNEPSGEDKTKEFREGLLSALDFVCIGKRGKVLSVEEIGKVMDKFVYVGTHKTGIMLMKEARDKIATAIFKAVYGEDKDV
jgi:hypothetical protein